MSFYEIFGFFLLFTFFYVVVPTLICFFITGKMLQKQQREQQQKEKAKIEKEEQEALNKEAFIKRLKQEGY